MPQLVVIDACRSDRPAGTIVTLSGDDIDWSRYQHHVNLHLFRWDHALAFGRSLLGADSPERVMVYLVEGRSFQPGATMTPAVADAVRRLADDLHNSFHIEEPADVSGHTGSSRIDL